MKSNYKNYNSNSKKVKVLYLHDIGEVVAEKSAVGGISTQKIR